MVADVREQASVLCRGAAARRAVLPTSSFFFTGPLRVPSCLAQCRALDSHFYLWWQVQNDGVVEIELEAAVDADTTWVAFGPTDSARWGMLNSDVVVTGFLNGAPKALDYYLSARSQCNYAATADRGVCPDDGFTACRGIAGAVRTTCCARSRRSDDDAQRGSNDVTLVRGEYSNGIQRVRYRRKVRRSLARRQRVVVACRC